MAGGAVPKFNLVAFAKTLNAALVPGFNDNPAVLVAVKVTPVPNPLNINPETTIEFEPDGIVPITVPPKVPAFPLEDNVNEEFAVTFVADP